MESYTRHCWRHPTLILRKGELCHQIWLSCWHPGILQGWASCSQFFFFFSSFLHTHVLLLWPWTLTGPKNCSMVLREGVMCFNVVWLLTNQDTSTVSMVFLKSLREQCEKKTILATWRVWVNTHTSMSSMGVRVLMLSTHPGHTWAQQGSWSPTSSDPVSRGKTTPPKTAGCSFSFTLFMPRGPIPHSLFPFL